MYFQAKTMKIIHIPMVLHVFKVLESRRHICPICPPRLPRTLKTSKSIGICVVVIDVAWKYNENHWNMQCFLNIYEQILRKPLEYLCFSMPMVENHTHSNGFLAF